MTDSILSKNADIVVITLTPSLWQNDTTGSGLTPLVLHQLLRNGLRVIMIAPDGRNIDGRNSYEQLVANNLATY